MGLKPEAKGWGQKSALMCHLLLFVWPFDIKKLPHRNGTAFDDKTWERHKCGSLIDVGMYPNSLSNYKKYLTDLREIYKPKDEFLKTANWRLRRLAKRRFNSSVSFADITFVGIHVRRSDYAHHLSILYNLAYVDDNYFAKATHYFREKYKVISYFIILTKRGFKWKAEFMSLSGCG